MNQKQITNPCVIRKERRQNSNIPLLQIHRKRKRAKAARLVNEIKILSFILLTIILIPFFFSMGSERIQAQGNYEKTFISVEIKSGDTLWGYAEMYANSDFYSSKQEYIKEVRLLNGLSSSKIYSGRRIALPVFEIKQ